MGADRDLSHTSSSGAPLDPFPALLEKLENSDRTIQQGAVKEIFNEILKRAKEDYILLTQFDLMDIDLITKVGKSLAIIGAPYFQVLDHMIDIQKWGPNWVTFSNLILPLYEKEYLNLLHTAKIILAFLSGGKKLPELEEQENQNVSSQSNSERLTEISSISKTTYQAFTKSYLGFYLKLKEYVTNLSLSTSSHLKNG